MKTRVRSASSFFSTSTSPTLVLVLGALCGALCSSAAIAAPGDALVESEHRGVIQNRRFKMGHELTFEAGTLPLDPFAKGVATSARYTFHINDFNAIELGGTYSYSLDSDLKKQLLDNFGVVAEQLPDLQAMVELNYVIKPFYGKFALVNRSLLYQELYACAGATGTWWQNDSATPLRVGPDIGGGVRFFLAEWASVRFDLRYALVVPAAFPPKLPFLDEDFAFDGVLYLGTGLSFNLGG